MHEVNINMAKCWFFSTSIWSTTVQLIQIKSKPESACKNATNSIKINVILQLTCTYGAGPAPISNRRTCSCTLCPPTHPSHSSWLICTRSVERKEYWGQVLLQRNLLKYTFFGLTIEKVFSASTANGTKNKWDGRMLRTCLSPAWEGDNLPS